MTERHYAVPSAIPSAGTAHIRRKSLDISYAGLSTAQKLDIYWPEEGDGPFPVIVSIHGGAFMGGDKGDVQVTPMLQGLSRGYAVVSINYRMSGEATFPALVHDAKAAVRWIRGNAATHRFDADRIAVWGGSAGGYLASMLGVSYGMSDLEDLSLGYAEESSRVQAVVNWFGPTDFLKMDEQLTAVGLAPQADQAHSGASSPESLLLGAKITCIPERVQVANPETYIRPDAPPFLLQHGSADDTVPHLQSVNFAAKLQAVLGEEKVTLHLLEGARHADSRFGSPENLERVFRFLEFHLK
jgi:acetyl esterase/lipase